MRTAGIVEFQCGLEKIPPANTHNNETLDQTNTNSNTTQDIFVSNNQSVQETPRQVDVTVTNAQIETIDDQEVSCMGDSNYQSLENILKTFVAVDSALWSTSTKPLPSIPNADTTIDDSDIHSMDFPGDYLADELVRNKVNFFNYWKSDVEIEVKANNAPTQQGCLYIWYEPLRGSNIMNALSVGTPRAGLAQLTSYPGVFLNLEETDSARLVLSWLWFQEFFDLTVRDSMGRIHVSVVAPLYGDSASDQVEIVVNVRCVDPLLRVPTTVSSAFTSAIAEPQMGEEEPKQGMITKLANGVAAVADVASGVPMISKIAASVSWGSRLLGRAATAMGFSKPISVQETKPVYRVPGFGLQQVEGVTPGLSLGAIQDNEIAHDTPAVDEMSFDYICKRSVVIVSKDISLPTFNTRGQTWLEMKTHPIPDEITYPLSSTLNTVSGGPMQAVAAQFQWWRGILKYDFKLIKTKFHKGRLQVSWIPGKGVDRPGLNINKVYTKIWDVGTSSDFSFQVPFVLPSGYANVATAATVAGSVYPGYTGKLVVKVFNKFNYPETVPSNLTLLVSLSGIDMEFSGPFMNTRYATVSDLMPGPTPPPKLNYSKVEGMPSDEWVECSKYAIPHPHAKAFKLCRWFTPMQDYEFSHPLPVAEPQGGEESYERNFSAKSVATHIGGEKISSLRQLLKKQTTKSGRRWYQNHTTTLASMYALYSGSFTDTLIGHTPNITVKLSHALAQSDSYTSSNPAYPFMLSSDGVTQVKIPFYCPFPSLPTMSVYQSFTETNGDFTATRLRGIGDDYCAWYLIAPPTLVVNIRGDSNLT